MSRPASTKTGSVERSLEIFGDRWSILILREAFFGVRHYDEMQENLGIATNVLSGRLKRLVANGILCRRKDAEDGRRVEYRLTEKGLDLYPVTLALMQWGNRSLSDMPGRALALRHTPCGRRLKPVTHCAGCGEKVVPQDVSFG